MLFLIIKVDSYDSLPLGKTATLQNVIILINSVFNGNQNNYYCNIFLETITTFFLIAQKCWDLMRQN